ncbi:hypothetical protein OIU84_002130 [Salix udensis]|uniref:Glucosamine/galactosamine-6-phosphate isomerase domain-containing protein n=1 Tax=Salix udensis TaxID=889485 RepID=A0AAD6K8L5_9ROSI|nr:hypothetical protein OIU84_002130 [Salix udensis]
MAKAASSLTFYTSLPKLCRPFSISITQPPQVSLNSKKPSCSISSAFKISRRTVTTTKASSMASSGITTVDQNNRKVVEVFVTEEELAVSLAKYTADLSDKFAKERGSFTVVVSGGSLIKSLRKLVEAPYVDSIDWSKWHVFWVDERVVPKDHPDSNYKLAFDGFLSKVPIPSGNVYAINDALSAEGAADDYETRLKHLVHTGVINKSSVSGFPKFDLMLVGMGPDGTCSLPVPWPPTPEGKSEMGYSHHRFPKTTSRKNHLYLPSHQFIFIYRSCGMRCW